MKDNKGNKDKTNSTQLNNIKSHIKNAKAMWDNPDVNTPGNSIEEFLVGSYASSLKGASTGNRGRERGQGKQPALSAIQRYKGYFNV